MLTNKGIVVTLRWIPAHTGVKNNKEVDLLTKLITEWKPKKNLISIFTTFQYTWIPQLVSSCKRTINTRMERYKYVCWYADKTNILYRKRYPNFDSKINNLYNNLTRTQSLVFIQMRTEKIGLNGYLYRISKVETAWCDCNQLYQTVLHIIEDCVKYRKLRKEILSQAAIYDYRLYLSQLDLISQIATFILATRFLGQFAKVIITISQLK